MSQIEALALSMQIEAFVAALAVGALAWGSARRAALIAAAATLTTHWAVWAFVLNGAPSLDYYAAAATAEFGAVVVEAVLYVMALPASAARALALSLSANGASFAAGLVFAS
ncbi:MAG: hypothetical protein ACK4MV_07405 [Beijerinckiaceae bacterium]